MMTNQYQRYIEILQNAKKKLSYGRRSFVCNIITTMQVEGIISPDEERVLLDWIHSMLGSGISSTTMPYTTWLTRNNRHMNFHNISDADKATQRIIWLDRLIYELEEGRMD